MRWLIAFAVMGCTEHGESPSSCEADFVLDGSPGAFENARLELTGNQRVELCLALDATQNTSEVTLHASIPSENAAVALTLRSLDGLELAADHGALSFVFPPGTSLDVWLSLELVPPAIGLSTQLQLELVPPR